MEVAFLHVVLYRPLIPQNTGNIARTCAVTGSKLHLIEELGFSLDEKKLKRAGLDYWHLLDIEIHRSFEAFLEKYGDKNLFLVTKFAKTNYSENTYTNDCFFMFGQETRGLPQEIMDRYPDRQIRIPMMDTPYARSINLSTSVGIVLYEGLRQIGFESLV